MLAGPGSGKTYTLVNRILYLTKKGIDPSSILVITFTKDAAVSMQQRFLQLDSTCKSVNFGTFHSLFYHILQQTHPNRKCKFLTGAEKRQYLKPFLREWNIRNHQYPSNQELDADAEQFLSAISFYKNTSQLPNSISKVPPKYQEVFTQIFHDYQQKIQEVGALDFDDMLFECKRLLTQEEQERRKWAARFQHILIDEFQDINPIQYEVIRLLTDLDSDLFVVGDDDQAIYGFRGARPDIMKEFERDYRAKRLYLLENYRSRPQIVEASLRVIRENKGRYEKKLFAAGRFEEEETGGAFCLKPFETREQQYAYLCEEAKAFSQEHAEDGQTLAIIFRTNLTAQALATRFTHQGIPFFMKEQMRNVYEHFLVKDICAYLLLAAGQWKREHLVRIVNKPSRYIHREAIGEEGSLAGMREYYRLRPGNVRGQSLSQPEQIDLLERQLKLMKNMPLTLSVNYICKAIRYEEYLKQKAEYDPLVLEEWMEILNWLKEDAARYSDVFEWMRGQEAYAKALENRRENHCEKRWEPVRLMTAHSSKGLEFTRVLIPDCNEKVYPHGSMPERDAVEEERRLFYVAMTRAQKNLELLFLTGEKTHPRLPSRFLNVFLKEKYYRGK